MTPSRRRTVLAFILAIAIGDVAVAAEQGPAPAGDTATAAAPASSPNTPATTASTVAPSGSAPSADRGVTEKKEEEKGPEARVPWKGTALKWSQSVTTTALGIGSDYQSSSYQVYTHGYWVLLNYYLVDTDTFDLRVTSSPGFDVEYTNSETTTEQREPQFRDLNLSLIAKNAAHLDSKKEYVFETYSYATALFPTSEASQSTGTLLVTSPRVLLDVAGPLLPDAAFPKDFAVGADIRWDHRFSRATEPVNPALLDRPRQASTGEVLFTDQLSGSPFAHDTIEAGGLLELEGTLFDQLLLFEVAASWSKQYLYPLDESACVTTVASVCSEIQAGNAPKSRVTTSFSAEFLYFPMPELGFSLGYVNEANQLAPNGQRRSIFYSPDALFTTQLVISLDAIYEGLTGPRRGIAFYLPG